MHALTIALLAAALAFYLLGVTKLWRKAGARRALGLAEVTFFTAGWLAAALALLSPLHHYAERLLWAHMVQHELLMVVAAPLLVLGRPVEAWSWVLPLKIPRLLSDPVFACALHAAAVWLWHAPLPFGAAADSAWLHLAQHASFFVSAAIFWWTVLAPGPRPLPALVSLLLTMIHTGVLGALLTFSRAPWYAGYGLEDQQLAGLVMWVPAGLAYPLAALLVVFRLLHYSR